MLFNPKNAITTGLSFLSSTKAPPNTPECEIERLKSINHMESKKFYIVITSVVILAFFYFASIGILFLIPQGTPEFFTGFVTLFSKTIEILSIIIAAYVGAQAVVDLKYGSQSSVNSHNNTNTERIEELTIIQTNVKEEDYELK